MSSIGVTPGEAGALAHPESPAKAMLQGGVIFAIVSAAAYSIWAFRLFPGTAAMYSSIAAVYIGLAGFALSRLLPAGSVRKRFPLHFAIGFAAYAICWCAFWFGMKGRHQADLWGAAVGLAVMTWLLRRSLGCSTPFLPLYAVLFTTHALGYTLGGELYHTVGRSGGRLLWGVSHGLGFGAGLGYMLAQCRRPSDSPTLSAA